MNQKIQVHFKGIQKIIGECLDKSDKSILIAVAWITDEFLIKKIVSALEREVKVSIIFYSDKINNKDLFKKLFDLGAEIKYTKNLMHNKFCVIDDNIVINGSYNWTNNAKNNNENIQITNDIDKISYQYINEFEKLFNAATSIDGYFKTLNQKYDDIRSEFEKPNEFPVFLRINFSKTNFTFYSSADLGYGFSYIFLKDENDYEYLVDFYCNDKLRNPDFRFKSLNLKIYKNVFEIDDFLISDEIKYKKFIYSDVDELELFMKEGLLRIGINIFAKIDRLPLNQLFTILLSHKSRIPENISSVKELEDFAESLKLIMFDVNDKIYFSDERLIYSIKCKMPSGFNNEDLIELVLYKIYYNVPLNFDNYHVPYYNQQKNVFMHYLKITKDNFVVLDYKHNNYYTLNLKGEIISKVQEYKKFSYDLKRSYESSIFSISKTHCISYKALKVKDAHIKYKWVDFFYYGVIDIDGKEIVPPVFDYVIEETDVKIVFEIYPFISTEFYPNEYYFYNTSASFLNDNNNKYLALRFEYLIQEKRIIQKNFKLNQNHIYLSDENFKYYKFYMTIMGITKNKHIIEIVKKYLTDNNKLDINEEELKLIIKAKILEINKIETNKKIENKNCYIATLVYGDIDHPKVDFFRNFRDTYLADNYLGKVFVSMYYKYSPSIVDFLRSKTFINKLIKFFLDFIISIISILIRKK